MDPTTRDRRRVARDPLMAHYGGLATPGPDSPSGPLGPADAHQHSAVETGDAAVRDSVSRHWAFWLIGKDVIRIERERVEPGVEDGVVPVHQLSPQEAGGEWWPRKGAWWQRGLRGEEEVEPSVVHELQGSCKKLFKGGEWMEEAWAELSTST
jgi:hypothetical protein